MHMNYSLAHGAWHLYWNGQNEYRNCWLLFRMVALLLLTAIANSGTVLVLG